MNIKVVAPILVICTALLWASTGALAAPQGPDGTLARGTLIQAHMEACRGHAGAQALKYPEPARVEAFGNHYSVCMYARGYKDGREELQAEADAYALANQNAL